MNSKFITQLRTEIFKGIFLTSCFSILFIFQTNAYDNSAPAALSASFVKTNVSVCGGGADGTITISTSGATGSCTYSWTASNGFTLTTTNPALTALAVGFYNVTITDAAFNTTSLNNIHIGFAFAVFITNSGNASSTCSNTGGIILYGTSGVLPYSYSLNGTTYQSWNTFENLAPGNYTAYIKDARGCVSSKSVSVGTAPSMTATAYVRASGYCANDGQIQLFRNGGIPPYTYSLNDYNYQASNVFSNLIGGTSFTGFVKDSRGCKAMVYGLAITKENEMFANSTKVNSSPCINDGRITMSATGGYPPYSYSLDNVTFQSSPIFNGLGPNHYFGWVRDSRGCKLQKITTINTTPIIVTSMVDNVTDCGTYNGKIQLNNTGGRGPLTYSIDGNNYQTYNTFNGLPPGTYTGYVKDSMICIGVLSNILVNNNCISRQSAPATSNSGNNETVEITSSVKKLNVQLWPNITSTDFRLVLNTSSNEKISIIVTNFMGGKVYQSEATGKQQLRFGSNFTSGMYLLQVMQGNEKQTLRLIKE